MYLAPRKVVGAIKGIEVVEMPRNGTKGMCCGAGGARMWMEENIGTKVNDERAVEAISTGASRVATACPFCYIMLDDGVKAAGKEDNEVKVADISIHLLDAIEAGERRLASPDTPIATGTPVVVSPIARGAGTVAVAEAPAATMVATPEAADDELSPADNLQLVVGIGPKNEQSLNAGGVFTFEQLAALTVEQIQVIMPDHQDERVASEDWIGQAQKYAEAKAQGIDPATIAPDDQVT